MRSLTHRLVLRLMIVLIAAMVLGAAAIGWRALVAIYSLDDYPLQSEARVIASALRSGSDGHVRVDLPPALAVLFSMRKNESAYLIADAAGKPLLGSNPSVDTTVADLLPRRAGLFRLSPMPGHPAGLIGYAAQAGKWRIFVLQGREQLEALGHSLIREFFTTGLMLLILIGAVAILIAAWTVRQGLAPARAASAAALAIGPSRPGLRLPEERQPGEIAPLVRAVNEAVARLEDALAAQRRFVGDAAHTLRTPLAVLMARLDALPDSAEKAGLRQDANRMARLVGQMLQMARIEGAPLDVSGEIDLREAAREVIATLGPLAVRRGLDLALTGGDEPCRIRGNRAALLVALENLADNALRHAPAGSVVEVGLAPPARVSRAGSWARAGAWRGGVDFPAVPTQPAEDGGRGGGARLGDRGRDSGGSRRIGAGYRTRGGWGGIYPGACGWWVIGTHIEAMDRRKLIPERWRVFQNVAKAPEATEKAAEQAEPNKPREIGGPAGPEPTRYGDWERKGRCTDF